MSKLKVGDRVRVKDAPMNTGCDMQIGATGTVVDLNSRAIKVAYDKPNKWESAFLWPQRFELIEAVKTDEELATEYRQARKNCKEMNEELRRRGWTVGGAGDNITIKKYVTSVLEI